MRIAIVGTSNSIGSKGYVSGLKESGYVSALDNFSLGHSTSVVLPYALSRFSPKDYDFCILDFVVNEEDHVEGVTSIETIDALLHSFISDMAESDCMPVFLMMPSLRPGKSTRPVWALYRNLAMRYRYPFFDGYTLLKNIRKHSRLSTDECFRDPAHLHNWAAVSIGFALSRQLLEIKLRRPERRIDFSNGSKFGYMPLAGTLGDDAVAIEQATVRERKTSLLHERFLRFGQGGSFSMAADSFDRVVGIGINLGQSNMEIRYSSGANSERVYFSTSYYTDSGSAMVFVVRPVPSLICQKNELRIFFDCHNEAKSHYERFDPACEIHGITIERKEMQLKRLRLDLDLIDMAGSMPCDFYKLVAAVATRARH